MPGRYVHQPDPVSCGPVAVINVAKYYNMPLTLKHDFPWIRQACDPGEQGITPDKLEKILHEVFDEFLVIKRRLPKNFAEIDKFLKRSDAVIVLGYAWSDRKYGWRAHWTVITGRNSDGSFEVLNDNGRSVSFLPPKALSALLRNQSGIFPTAFFITER